MILSTTYHLPVLFPEVIKGLNVQKGAKYIDATLGGGGYTIEILKRGGIVLGIDVDQDAIEYVKKFRAGKELFLEQGNFADLKDLAQKQEFVQVSGILFDLGMSTHQLEHSGRGFSYNRDEPLDMRMDKKRKLTAADIVNNYSLSALYEILTKFAEELHSGAIARAILRTRSLKKEGIQRTKQLATIVEEVLQKIYPNIAPFAYERKINSTLARIFQALRIVVNDEIENLKKGLDQGKRILLPHGRIVVLSYHSLEDRVVKSFFKSENMKGNLQILTKKPIVAEREELRLNPKARSACLRIAEEL